MVHTLKLFFWYQSLLFVQRTTAVRKCMHQIVQQSDIVARGWLTDWVCFVLLSGESVRLVAGSGSRCEGIGVLIVSRATRRRCSKKESEE